MALNIRIPGIVKRHKWKFILGTAAFLALTGIVMAASRPKPPEYVTAVATQGDLVQTVEAVGTVTSDKDLNLQFRTSGIVSGVFVKVGDRVRTGQRLAALRAGTLSASIASASARVQEAEANYQALQEGARPEDIAVEEANLANKRAALTVAQSNLQSAEDSLKASQARLDALKKESDVSLGGEISLAASTVSQKLTVADQALATIDDVFGRNDVQDAAVRDDPGTYQDIRTRTNAARDALRALQARPISTTDYASALRGLQDARAALQQTSQTVDFAYSVLSRFSTTSYLTVENQATYKSTIAAQQTAIQTALRDIDTSIRTLQGAPSSIQTKIAAEESNLASAKGAREKAQSDILTYESAVRVGEAQLQLKRAGARQTDLNAALARLRQARADLARASADYADTVIAAPTDGVITKVNVKAGEASPLDAAITMIGNAPYRIEMFVSEIDVPKVMVTQSGSIELDSFRGTHFKLHVSQIDRAATDRDGVPKYRVLLDFDYPHDELKIGMTGDAAIETGVRRDVVSVPLRAVIRTEENEPVVRILKDDGTVEERPVQTGMEGGSGDVEVLGVKGGEKVVVLVKP